MPNITLDDITHAANVSGLVGFKGIYEPLGGGEVNDTFLLSCGNGKTILRIAKYPDQDSLRQEARALRLLDSVQIPKLIFFDENKRINGRQWIMEGYVPGTTMTRLSVDQFKSLGSLLADVHRTKSGIIGVDIWSNFLDVCKMFGNEEYLLNHPDPTLNELIKRATEYFRIWQARLDEIPESLIHGDATPSNILVMDNDVSLIDWEFSKYSDPLAEFSTVFYEDMEYNQGKWRVRITEAEKSALYSGYTSAGGIIDVERIKLWMNFDKLGAAVFLNWRINQSNREANEEQNTQYKFDLNNLVASLKRNLAT